MSWPLVRLAPGCLRRFEEEKTRHSIRVETLIALAHGLKNKTAVIIITMEKVLNPEEPAN